MRFTFNTQIGAMLAQVFGPDGKSVATFDATDPPEVANARAASMALLLNGGVPKQAHPEAVQVPQGFVPAWGLERMRHIANEWADMAANGLQWLRNVRDGVSDPKAAVENMEKNAEHCRQVTDAPGLYGDAQPPAQAEARCPHCDGTGDFHDQTGEWRGVCTCEAGQQIKAQAEARSTEQLDALDKRRIFDAIRGAYDLGYNDARSAKTVPGDGAPGYAGRDVETDHGGALIRSLETRRKVPQPVGREVLSDGERDELERLRSLVNTPTLHSFRDGVVLEAAHQRERWGSAHDAGKQPSDWFWLVGYLAGKALHAQTSGNTEKALHHTISTAAALANWHAAIGGESTAMRPGIDPAAHGITGEGV